MFKIITFYTITLVIIAFLSVGVFMFGCKSINSKSENKYSYETMRKWFNAVERGDIETINYMLKSGFKIDIIGYNPEGGDYGFTALMLASSFGDLNTVKFLISKGAKINVKTLVGSPLLMAISNNHDEVAAFLISKKADVNISSVDGRTPLMAAASEGNSKMVYILLKFNADKNARHSSGRRAIDYAKEGRFYDIVNILD